MPTKFPYEFRKGQKEALSYIKKNIKSNLCIDASTGFGKTAIILAALLPSRVIWAVRTGNEADRPIEELRIVNKKLRKNFFGFSLRGKKDMCLLARDKGLSDTESVAYLCKRKKNECKYYDSLRSYRIKPAEPMLYSEIIRECRDAEVCPYYLQRELLYHADVVSLSYNYIVHAGLSWVIKSIMQFNQCFLVVDEAHNLRLIGSLNSDEITLNTLKNALKELDELKESKLREAIVKMLSKAEELRRDMLRRGEEERAIDIKIFECDYLNAIRTCGEKIRQQRLEGGKTPRSSLYHLAMFLIESFKNAGIRGVEFIASVEKDNLKIERWDMRSAEILRDRWRLFKSCVFCSGTLKPIRAFAETIGLEGWKGRSFKTEIGKCKSLVVKGVSTKGEELDSSEAEKYLKLLNDFLEIDANLAVFSASYRIQNSLLPKITEIAEKNDKEVFLEKQGMSGDESRRVLEGFKDYGGVLVATMTGRFAEGADFPGKELEGIFLVGIPFDRMTLRTQLYLNYYKELYGDEKGWYYSYVIPALQRASQALGRALRSKDDKALFVFGDERYRESIYSKLLPDFVKLRVVELEDAGIEIKRAWNELQ
jgi:DNA excision repair protein ERCC-2